MSTLQEYFIKLYIGSHRKNIRTMSTLQEYFIKLYIDSHVHIARIFAPCPHCKNILLSFTLIRSTLQEYSHHVNKNILLSFTLIRMSTLQEYFIKLYIDLHHVHIARIFAPCLHHTTSLN